MTNPQRILVIRRDNIGDLVCTTPLLSALRSLYPRAWIGALTSSYTAPVLYGNPDVDEVFTYRKLKHLRGGDGVLSALFGRASLIWRLRRSKLDLAILAAGSTDSRGEAFARQVLPGRTIASAAPKAGQHEVERTLSAAHQLGFSGSIPPLRIVPDPGMLTDAEIVIRQLGSPRPLIGMHISARRVSQRWTAQKFAQLAETLHEIFNATTLLFWSPGANDHPQHPGDDDKAKEVMAMVRSPSALLPYPTTELSKLIAGLAQCDTIVCSDGGAMHIAAALGKPIACFFGDSPVERWRPWGVRHAVLKAPSCKAEDVPVGEALAAIGQLLHG